MSHCSHDPDYFCRTLFARLHLCSCPPVLYKKKKKNCAEFASKSVMRQTQFHLFWCTVRENLRWVTVPPTRQQVTYVLRSVGSEFLCFRQGKGLLLRCFQLKVFWLLLLAGQDIIRCFLLRNCFSLCHKGKNLLTFCVVKMFCAPSCYGYAGKQRPVNSVQTKK